MQWPSMTVRQEKVTLSEVLHSVFLAIPSSHLLRRILSLPKPTRKTQAFRSLDEHLTLTYNNLFVYTWFNSWFSCDVIIFQNKKYQSL